MTKNKGKEPRNYWALVVSLVAFFGGQFLLYHLEAPVWVQFLYCIGFIGLFVGTSTRRHSYVFIFRVYIPIVVGLSLVALYFQMYENAAFSNMIDSSKFRFRYLELLFDVLSTLYAICTAFLLWKGLTDHDNLRHVLRDEANQIQRVVGFLHYFDAKDGESEGAAGKILNNFHKYVCNIIRDNKIQAHEENLGILRGAIDEIKKVKVEDENDKVALAEVMKGISELVMVRSKRISQMEIGMSPYLLSALIIMSLAILYPFFTEGPLTAGGESDYVNIVCIFTLGSLLSFLQMTLYDIGRPFDGYWHIKLEAFEQLRTMLESEIKDLDAPQKPPAT